MDAIKEAMIRAEDRGTSVADYRKLALQDLAIFCSGIIPSAVGYAPTARDGIELANDLRLLAKRVDRVINAYGDYAESCIGNVDRSFFVNPLESALEGNALYVLEEAARESEEANSQFGVGA